MAKDPAVIDRIAHWRWDQGLRPRPDAPVWRMDEFRDRFVVSFSSGGQNQKRLAARVVNRRCVRLVFLGEEVRMTERDVVLMQHLHDEHGAALWRFCRRLVPDDRGRAEDVAQETLLRAWQHRTILEGPAPAVRAWLFKVARNIVIDQWRSPRTRRETPVAEVPESRSGDETDKLLLSWVVAEAAHPALAGAPRRAAGVLLPWATRGGGGHEARGAGGHRQVAHALRAACTEAGAGGDGGRRMRCQHAHEDGAYVLGALSPADRRDFDRHLPGCADCTRAVGGLAGLPGLLGLIGARASWRTGGRRPGAATLLPAPARRGEAGAASPRLGDRRPGYWTPRRPRPRSSAC